MLFTFILAILLAGRAWAYSLSESYNATNFFDKFEFFTEACPTHGFVNYVDYPSAVGIGLIDDPQFARWAVDSTTVLSSRGKGRASVRMTSKTHYNQGLFIADIVHMPDSTCGLWPAFWFLGQTGDWPHSGELDILEAVNTAAANQIIAHTSASCSVNAQGQTAQQLNDDCAVPSGYKGCGSLDTRNTSYGTGFNDNGGGVYAMEWTSQAIKVWFFPRDDVPASIAAGNPDPSKDFGKPTANFDSGSCDIDQHFFDMAIVFDTTFCGDWAGETYQQDGCSMFSGQSSKQSCVSYVARNPEAFEEAYWEVDSIQVYTATP